MAKGNKEHVFDVVANKLKLYDQIGDAFKGLFTQFARCTLFVSMICLFDS